MRLVSGALGAASFLLSSMFAAPALAVGEDEAGGPPKGTIGGVLLGAELVLVVEAAFDVQPTWAYIAGGLGGALGGGIAGYYIEQDASPRVSMLMLASGLTLAIPTVVAVLSATAYEPPADYLEDTIPPDEPVADPPQSETSRAPRRTHSARLRLTPPGLVDIDAERVALAIPAVTVSDVFTPTERFVFGAKQATEVRVPVLTVAF
jgi:hypothetical protein